MAYYHIDYLGKDGDGHTIYRLLKDGRVVQEKMGGWDAIQLLEILEPGDLLHRHAADFFTLKYVDILIEALITELGDNGLLDEHEKYSRYQDKMRAFNRA